MNKDHTVEELMAEIADSAAREADLRNRVEVAEARLVKIEELAHNWARTSEYVTGDTTAEQVITGSLESSARALRRALK